MHKFFVLNIHVCESAFQIIFFPYFNFFSGLAESLNQLKEVLQMTHFVSSKKSPREFSDREWVKYPQSVG